MLLPSTAFFPTTFVLPSLLPLCSVLFSSVLFCSVLFCYRLIALLLPASLLGFCLLPPEKATKTVFACLLCCFLSCLTLSCLVLSCLVLSGPRRMLEQGDQRPGSGIEVRTSCGGRRRLSCLVLSCIVLSCVVVSCCLLLCLVLSCLVL